jgi:murein DD-endopeptidase MepM/ murein hydrolase activator NlpD
VRQRPFLLLAALGAAAALALALGPAAGTTALAGGATARAWAIRILVPGRPAVGTRVLAAPATARAVSGGRFVYPADGSVVTARSVATHVAATSGAEARARAVAGVTSLSLFRGEIAAAAVGGRTHALASPASASGGIGVSGIAGLVVLGRAVKPTANRQIALADWGYAIALEQAGRRTDKPAPGYHDFVTALDVFLTARHGGLPAGSELQIGYAEADAQAGHAEPLPPAPSEPATKQPPEPGGHGIPSLLSKPLSVTPSLGETGYVFPVYGNSSFVDTFGAFRADVPGNWHHGDDIFAALGTPVLAVADSTVFSVGWNRVGGWRLWLRDDHGNEFYYAHLSAYSPLAVDGASIDAGDVLGFVGDSGDAEGTSYHLHFEIHPVGLLGLGYDGAVDPTSYLGGWRRLRDVRIEAAAGWVRGTVTAAAPKAGAILLQSSDISNASGLDPKSLGLAAVRLEAGR